MFSEKFYIFKHEQIVAAWPGTRNNIKNQHERVLIFGLIVNQPFSCSESGMRHSISWQLAGAVLVLRMAAFAAVNNKRDEQIFTGRPTKRSGLPGID